VAKLLSIDRINTSKDGAIIFIAESLVPALNQ